MNRYDLGNTKRKQGIVTERSSSTMKRSAVSRLTAIPEPRAAAPKIMLGIVGGLISMIMIGVGITENANALYDSPGTPIIAIGAIVGLVAAIWMLIGIYRVVSSIDTLIADRYELTKFRTDKQAQ